jgi:hypothetical protein
MPGLPAGGEAAGLASQGVSAWQACLHLPSLAPSMHTTQLATQVVVDQRSSIA